MRETDDGKNVMGNLLYVPLDYNILGKLYMDSIITYAGLSFVNKTLVMLFVDISVTRGYTLLKSLFNLFFFLKKLIYMSIIKYR